MYSISQAASAVKQSPIRSMSKLCYEMGGINLGQGVCDLSTPESLKKSASESIYADKNKYAACEGVLPLREALAQKISAFNKIDVNPITQVMVSHGSTGAYVSAVATLFNPKDQVVLFEPFYGYHRGILQFFGIDVAPVDISFDGYQIDWVGLEKALKDPKTKGMILCSPCNPSGKVFSKEELFKIGELCKKNDVFIITDEIYEYITYPGYEHTSIAALGFFYNTITISGFSKTYNMTGWRLGYASGPAPIIEKMSTCHDLFYVCPPTPLQHGTIQAPFFPDSYYQALQKDFLVKRDLVVGELRDIGFSCATPEGAYYIMADFSKFAKTGDDFAMQLLEKSKVATVPGRAFYVDPKKGANCIRFCYAVEESILKQAMQNIRRAFA